MVRLSDILLEVENDTTAIQAADNIGDDIVSAFEKELKQSSEQQNEAILTTAALILSIPGLINSVSKIAKAISTKYYKGIDLTRDDPKKWYNIVGKFTEKIDDYIGKPFDIVLRPIVKDNDKRKKIVNLLKAVSIVALAIAGSVDLSKTPDALNSLKQLAGSLAGELTNMATEKSLPKLIDFTKKTVSSLLK